MTRRWGLNFVTLQLESDAQAQPAQQHDKNLDQIPFLSTGYQDTLVSQLISARDDFNTAINWAITSLSVVLVLILTASSFPSLSSWLLTLVLLLMCSHFATRAARGYLNILRWALILRRVTELNLAQTKGASASELDTLEAAVLDAVAVYHIDWKSPMSRTGVISKVIFEFGFGYFYVILLGLLVWLFFNIPHCLEMLITGGLVMVLSAWEWSLLLRSQYLRHVSIGDETSYLVSGEPQ